MIKFNFENLMADKIGNVHGITKEDFRKMDSLKKEVIKAFNDKKQMGKFPFMDIPFKSGEVPDIESYVSQVKGKFKNFVVIGIGGSSLGCICILESMKPNFYNLLPNEKRGGPRIFIPDNIDPELIHDLFEVIKPEETLFNIITKSGSTSETMANFLIVKRKLKEALGDKYTDNLVFTTDPEKGDLRTIADKENIKTFTIPPEIGGRFSVLTSVGLLMAAMAGVNLEKLLDGAQKMVNRVMGEIEDIAFLTAYYLYILEKQKGKNIFVMMPYANNLYRFADWFRQIWAESLGKKMDVNGKIIYAGQTPVKSLGATDQHSQIQLYNEGPNDKVINFIKVEEFENDVKIPVEYKEYKATEYLCNHSLQELINVEQYATEIAVTKNEKPNFRITCPKVNEETLGELFMFWEIVTVYMGEFYKINPFDQPGVEEGKNATYHLLGRKGYEDYSI
ncbi:glucose-6-phosphate isomerase [Candidatus Dependentiae bacterium]|nr:glucose-6-phosphate isomerase [Candidatus Dependentiae bacterium]